MPSYRESLAGYVVRIIGTIVFAMLIIYFAIGSSNADEFAPLAGNHLEAAAGLAAEGVAAAHRPLQLEIYLSPRNKAERDRLAEELQDPNSPNYHKFLTVDEYAQRFGPIQDDVDQLSNWLTSQGFSIKHASAREGRILFTGDVATAQKALRVHIAASHDGRHFANLEDPQAPAELASKISFLAGLENLSTAVWHAEIPDPPYDVATAVQNKPYFGPTDIQTFSDESPLLSASPTKWDGTGQCIAVSEGSDVDQASLNQFSEVFGLPAFTPGTNYDAVFPDGAPGTPTSAAGVPPYEEAMLDIEYAHGLAPGAEIVLYAANAATDNPNGPQDLVDTIVAINNDTKHKCNTVAVSWAQCSAPSFFTTLDGYFQQGAMEGKSFFVASGDTGAAGIVQGPDGCVTGKTRHIEENAGSPNVTAVGASAIVPTYNTDGDDTSTDAKTNQSVWDWSLTSNLSLFSGQGASTGGASQIFALPSWQQKIPGISGKFRVVPDLVLPGANDAGVEKIEVPKKGKIKVTGKLYPAPGFWFCGDLNYLSGNSNASIPYWEAPDGGTSIVPPQYAAIFAVINQKSGAADGQGLINPKLYAMATKNSKNLAAVGILDITTGKNSYAPVAGYSARKGFDYASGWGSIDINNFVNAYIAFTP